MDIASDNIMKLIAHMRPSNQHQHGKHEHGLNIYVGPYNHEVLWLVICLQMDIQYFIAFLALAWFNSQLHHQKTKRN